MTSRLLNIAIAISCAFWSVPAAPGSLAESPLYLQSAVPPNVLFALSVEYPTANTAAYQGTNDYSEATTYLGLFDSEKCYDYSTTDDRFNPVSLATVHDCTGHWSGNFLNWATMTGLDEFRYAMTGGDRHTDTSSLTVLQRTYQSGQGGASNFPDKTYSGTTATPFAGVSLSIVNQGKGTQMTVSTGRTGTALCTDPQLSGSSFSCTLAMQTSGEAGACTNWGGSGTSTNPYRCTTFGNFTGIGTPTSNTPGGRRTFSQSSTDTVSCTSPSVDADRNFTCTLRDAASNLGSCTDWSGDGSSGDPFRCSVFGTFAGGTFAASGYGGNSSFTRTNPAIQNTTENVTSCSIATSSPYRITCTLASGRQAYCNPSGNGTSGNPHQCNASSTGWTVTGSPSATRVSNINASSTTDYNRTDGGRNPRKYYKMTSVTYRTSSYPTYYYTPSYTGSSADSYYYNSTYALNFSASYDYYVRAKVCDSSIGLESNCERYGNSYKPVGEVQRNGEKMRFGVFSYYKANDIDNAVMRSKLKYVAPLRWASSGGYVTNSTAEWSSSTGVLVGNPDSSEASASYGGAVSSSGVINYINKFGTGAQGYKTYDNVGKLYYESLRYLRGLTPTSAFYSRASTSNNDGFPVITSWDDPVQYWCQKNYIITMGDTHTHCDKRLPGGSISSYGASQCTGNSQTSDQGSLSGDSAVNVTTLTNALGTLEGKNNLATQTFSGSASYYMSGLAYWAAKDGFRNLSGYPVKAKTFVIDVQEYGDLGVNSQYWYASKYGGDTNFDANGNPLNWSTSIPGYSGAWPKTLLPAGNPSAMIAAVKGALSQIASQSGQGSGSEASTGDIRAGNGINVYGATYNSSGWAGDLVSYRMNEDLTVNSTPVWRATTSLNPATLNPSSGIPPWTTRRVITFNDGLLANGSAGTASNARQGVDFFSTDSTGSDVFSSQFSARQQALLNIDPGSGASDGRGSERVDFIRGGNSNEGSNGYGWRSRVSTDINSGVSTAFSLGDFINSSPAYVRTPSSAYVPPADYSSFAIYAANVASRTPVVYVGGNDGMLHVFNAEDASDDGTSPPAATANSGKELLAYVPSAVYGKLNQLTWTNYSHKYFVDSTPVVASAQLSSSVCTPASDANKCWRTVVTGGLNSGGQGIYALDGTNPSSFSTASAKSLVFWEFTDRDDSDLGHTFSQPLVRKMNNGKWAVIIGNGYNNTTSDGRVSSNGRAYLYILFIDGPGFDGSGRGNAWTLNTHYRKIELAAPNEGSTPLNPANGLSTVFGLDKNGDNVVDALYAGDRYGNVWKIDVSSTDPANWGSAFSSGSTPLPLFTATTADSPAVMQQITTSPVVMPNPNGGYLVFFGTGSFVDESDNASPFSMNSFYGVWDKDDGTRVTSREKLQRQALLGTATINGTEYGVQSDCMPQYSSTPKDPVAARSTCPSSLAPSLNAAGKVEQQLGWVMDLKNNVSSTSNIGERYISSALPVLESGLLVFVTLTPTGDVCGGNSYDYLYGLNYLTGGAYSQPIFYTTSATTASALSVTITTSGGASVTSPPSAQKLVHVTPSGSTEAATGQNPRIVYYSADKGKSMPTGTGCTPFVKGRYCAKDKYGCVLGSAGSSCTARIKLPSPGTISWRQVQQ